jgi:hypothetical protein
MKVKDIIKETLNEWNLFLDDERNPKEDKKFVIARTSQEAISLIKKKGFPKYMSLDHDLGGDDTGQKFVKWITKEYIDKNLPDFSFNIHSANPVGKENMESLLNNFIKYKREE